MIDSHAQIPEVRFTKDGSSHSGDSDRIDFGIRLDKPQPRPNYDRTAELRQNTPTPTPQPTEAPLPFLVVLPDGTIIRKEQKGPTEWDKK